MMDKSMYLPNHPRYGVDICHAYSLKDMESLRGQGYITWKEFVELANKADDLRFENERLRDALEELVDAWDGYEMLAALDADVYRKAQAALEAAKDSDT